MFFSPVKLHSIPLQIKLSIKQKHVQECQRIFLGQGNEWLCHQNGFCISVGVCIAVAIIKYNGKINSTWRRRVDRCFTLCTSSRPDTPYSELSAQHPQCPCSRYSLPEGVSGFNAGTLYFASCITYTSRK